MYWECRLLDTYIVGGMINDGKMKEINDDLLNKKNMLNMNGNGT